MPDTTASQTTITEILLKQDMATLDALYRDEATRPIALDLAITWLEHGSALRKRAVEQWSTDSVRVQPHDDHPDPQARVPAPRDGMTDGAAPPRIAGTPAKPAHHGPRHPAPAHKHRAKHGRAAASVEDRYEALRQIVMREAPKPVDPHQAAAEGYRRGQSDATLRHAGALHRILTRAARHAFDHGKSAQKAAGADDLAKGEGSLAGGFARRAGRILRIAAGHHRGAAFAAGMAALPVSHAALAAYRRTGGSIPAGEGEQAEPVHLNLQG